jgi:hypothetical protein
MEREEPDHAAAPEQTETGFAEGVERERRTPEGEHVGSFAEGVERESATTEEEHVGDFAEGAEAHTPAEERTGRFSEGVETTPETPEKNLEGSFAEGVETHPEDRYEQAAEQATVREASDPDSPPGEGGGQR